MLRRRLHATVRENRVSRPHRLAHYILVAESSDMVGEAHFWPSIPEHVQRIVEREQSRTRECPVAPRVRRSLPVLQSPVATLNCVRTERSTERLSLFVPERRVLLAEYRGSLRCCFLVFRFEVAPQFLEFAVLSESCDTLVR